MPNSSAPSKVAVVGAGITGLAAAHRLLKQLPDATVHLLETSRRAGGIIRTEEADGFLMELGPDSFITNKPGGVTLCEELGYTDELISTTSDYRRSLVLYRGKPQPVPDGFMLMAPSRPREILKTPILSWSGKLRLLSEYLIPARKSDDTDESLASFVRRRFGRETLDRLVQPLIGGIYTSDPEKLSLASTLPRFPQMEREFGSVIRATLRQQSRQPDKTPSDGSGARYGLFVTPRKGLSDLISALLADLRQHAQFRFMPGTPVHSVTPAPQDSDGAVASRYTLELNQGESESYDAVILTLPTSKNAEILNAPEFNELSNQLKGIEYAGSAIVVSGHRLEDFEYPMNAFGLVVPECERRRILAASFTSRKFPGRAPDGHILLRTFVGGAMHPEVLERTDDQIAEDVVEELQSIFGMKGEPLFCEVVRYPNAMPQYHVGHQDRVAAIESSLRKTPGLQLAGSAYHGVGIPDSIASGRKAAEAVVSLLSRPR